MSKMQQINCKNHGSAIVEMTLLIPVYLGVIYLYILFFLFTIECGFLMQGMLEYIYNVEMTFEVQGESDQFSVAKQGNVQIVRASNSNQIFQTQLELKGSMDDATQKVRRWQIAVSTIS